MATAVPNRERILVADGDPLVRRFVGALLANNGYDVHLAEDGEAALRSAVSLKPRLLLIDLVLPGKDGFEVLHALKGEPATARVPVMILSAFAIPALRWRRDWPLPHPSFST